MTKAVQFLSPCDRIMRRLAELKIMISLKNGNIVLKAKPGVITPKCREVIKAQKNELLAYLAVHQPGGAATGDPEAMPDPEPITPRAAGAEPTLPIAKDGPALAEDATMVQSLSNYQLCDCCAKCARPMESDVEFSYWPDAAGVWFPYCAGCRDVQTGTFLGSVRQKTSKFPTPSWLVPGTPEWNKQVARHGVAEMEEQRAAFEAQRASGYYDTLPEYRVPQGAYDHMAPAYRKKYLYAE